MNLDELKNVRFFISLSYLIIASSLLTIFFTKVIKIILKKKRIINEKTNANEQDRLLSIVGRIMIIIIYSVLYIINEIYLYCQIKFDISALVGMLGGIFVTLIFTKGLYTAIRQYNKKMSAFQQLRVVENQIKKLQEEMLEIKQKNNKEEEIII